MEIVVQADIHGIQVVPLEQFPVVCVLEFDAIALAKPIQLLWNQIASGDYADAIRTGATMVRVGTAIFGARDYSK